MISTRMRSDSFAGGVPFFSKSQESHVANWNLSRGRPFSTLEFDIAMRRNSKVI